MLQCEHKGVTMNRLLVVVAAWGGAGLVALAGDQLKPEVREQIVQLEKELFDAKLSEKEAGSLLDELASPQKARKAVFRLTAEGQGRVDQIIAFARKSRDREVREKCADIVESLDAAWRATPAGQRLTRLYRGHAGALLPEYWKRFRKTSGDMRAIAMLTSADPEPTYKWLGQSKDRHDRLRYLLLRIRELTPDGFAARHIGQHTMAGLNLVAPELYPYAGYDGGLVDGRAKYMVGHVLLKVRRARPVPDGFGPPRTTLPKIGSVETYGRWVFLCTAYHGMEYLELGEYLYRDGAVEQRPEFDGGATYIEGLCPLPRLEVSQKQWLEQFRNPGHIAWWLEPYVPDAYLPDVRFTTRPGGAVAPKVTWPKDQIPVAKYVLPPPLPLPKTPDEAAERRKRAEAERKLAASLYDPSGKRDEKASNDRIKHAERAVQLDPASEEIAFEHLEALRSGWWCRDDIDANVLCTLAQRYFERFGMKNPDHAGSIHQDVRVRVQVGVRRQQYRITGVSDEIAESVGALKYLYDHAFEHNLNGYSSSYHDYLFAAIGYGMKQSGVSLEKREQWLDERLRRVDRRCDRIASGLDPKLDRRSHEDYLRIRFRAIELAIADRRFDRAKRLLKELQQRYERNGPPRIDVKRIRPILCAADDPEWLAEFDRWVRKAGANVVGLVPIPWPEIDVFDALPQEDIPPVSSLWFKAVALTDGLTGIRARPLVVGQGKLYVGFQAEREDYSRAPLSCGTLALDKKGRPVGGITEVEVAGIEHKAWQPVKRITKTPLPGDTQGYFAAGHLCLVSGNERPLTTFNPKTEQWTTYGETSGMPEWIGPILELDDHTIFGCSRGSHWTVDLKTRKVTIIRQADPQRDIYYPGFIGIWRNGDRWLGVGSASLYRRPLSKDFQKQPFLDGKLGNGWPPGRYQSIDLEKTFAVGGRRFVAGRWGLHEFDPDGRVLRSWWAPNKVTLAGYVGHVRTYPSAPVLGYDHTQAGPLLYSRYNDDTVAYEPATDTWYGPLSVSEDTICGTSDGVWLGHDEVGYVRNEDFKAAARKCGRAMTTVEYRKRQEERIAKLSPLDRAKVFFSMRKFDRAEPLLKQVLDAAPAGRDPDPKTSGPKIPEPVEALVLLGWLHDTSCKNKPKQAMDYYDRLAKHDNRTARFTGLYMKLSLLARQERWKEVDELGAAVCAEFPRVERVRFRWIQRNIDWWRQCARRELGRNEEPASE